MKDTIAADVHLYEDSRWKEEVLSRLEVAMDDSRNPGAMGFGDLGNSMEYGKSYRVTMTVEELPLSAEPYNVFHTLADGTRIRCDGIGPDGVMHVTVVPVIPVNSIDLRLDIVPKEPATPPSDEA